VAQQQPRQRRVQILPAGRQQLKGLLRRLQQMQPLERSLLQLQRLMLLMLLTRTQMQTVVMLTRMLWGLLVLMRTWKLQLMGG
jgi:hypothetical protein